MFEGNPATPEAIESILNAMEIGIEIAKKKIEKNIHLRNIKKTLETITRIKNKTHFLG